MPSLSFVMAFGISLMAVATAATSLLMETLVGAFSSELDVPKVWPIVSIFADMVTSVELMLVTALSTVCTRSASCVIAVVMLANSVTLSLTC